MNSPRNVRNFWLTLDVDGKQEQVATGPRSSDGGFKLEILMREDGTISEKHFEIVGQMKNDGTLVLSCTTLDGRKALSQETIETKR